jgi:ABC transporter substrate binding protein
MRRRDFLAVLGSAVAGNPLAVHAQQPEPIRRVVVLMGAAETPSSRRWLTSFLHRLNELGWSERRNLSTQVQWWNDEPEQMRAWAAELIASSPDVAVTFTNLALEVMKPIAGSVPIVFIGVGDPVGSGFVSSFAHPVGNITGFASHDPSLGGKWLEVLKETAPNVSRVLGSRYLKLPCFRPCCVRPRKPQHDWLSRSRRAGFTMPQRSNTSSNLSRKNRMAVWLYFRTRSLFLTHQRLSLWRDSISCPTSMLLLSS